MEARIKELATGRKRKQEKDRSKGDSGDDNGKDVDGQLTCCLSSLEHFSLRLSFPSVRPRVRYDLFHRTKEQENAGNSSKEEEL